MKKLVVFVLLCLIVFAGWKNLSSPREFTVILKDGRIIQVEDFQYDVHSEEGWSEFTLYIDIGKAEVPRDLQGVERIDVLDKYGYDLRVTYRSGDVVEGKRKKKIGDSDWPPWGVYDRIKGRSGKYNINIYLSEIASITRGRKGE
jgi:hypothetical protein